PAGSAALVALTDYMTPGHAARIDLRTFSVADNVLALGEDSALKRFGDRLYVINEFGATDADNVIAYPMPELSPVMRQTSTGRRPQAAGAPPRATWWSGARARSTWRSSRAGVSPSSRPTGPARTISISLIWTRTESPISWRCIARAGCFMRLPRCGTTRSSSS